MESEWQEFDWLTISEEWRELKLVWRFLGWSETSLERIFEALSDLLVLSEIAVGQIECWQNYC